MQTLGLASEQQPTDGLLKRLFWPTIENEYDVDLLRVQGFWLCTTMAVLTLLQLVFSHTTAWLLLIPLVYFLAGIGLREGSVGAAVMILLAYVSDKIVVLEVTPFAAGSPVLAIFIAALLLSNVRAAILSKRWQREHGTEGVERPMASPKDRFVNSMPATVWPRAQYVFFPLASGLILFMVFLIVKIPAIQKQREAARRQQQQLDQLDESTQPRVYVVHPRATE